MKHVSVGIIEDIIFTLQGLQSFIETKLDSTVIWSTPSGIKALQYCNLAPPDVILIDTHQDDLSTIELVHSIRKQYKNVIILVLVTTYASYYIRELAYSGAQGVIDITQSQQLEEILTTISKRKVYVQSSPIVTFNTISVAYQEQQKKHKTGYLSLTDHEKQIFSLIADGLSDSQIARKLNITSGTVATITRNIREKMHVANRSQLASAYVIINPHRNYDQFLLEQ